jgi:hypothetical protein
VSIASTHLRGQVQPLGHRHSASILGAWLKPSTCRH